MENINTYSVVILRRDNEHITVLETEDYDKAYESWTKLYQDWVTCLHEQKSFVMEKPIVTAFDPGLIYEIKVLPVSISKSIRDNPYTNKMRQEGFSKTFGNYAGGNDILDGGYKS
jgi:hypothetical protein